MIKIICIGKLKEKAMLMLEAEYLKRLKPYHKIEVIEVKDVAIPEKINPKIEQQILLEEGKKVLEKIKNEYVIILDLHGKSISSEQFATKIDTIFTSHNPNITFVIGGSLGVSETLIARSDFRLNISNFTFTHQMCRILLLEQIYRSFKILNNEKYHK